MQPVPGRTAIQNEWRAKGYADKNKDGEPICYNWNLPKGCTAAAAGQKCPRGWHVCAAAGCQQRKEPHSATAH